MPHKISLLIFTILLFACGSKKQNTDNKSTDSTTVQVPEAKPDEKNMDHYISGYQNWVIDNEMPETLARADIWYDGKFIIVSDSSRKSKPKFILKISKKTEEIKTELSKDLGGIHTSTVYELEPNDDGFEKLIVFTNQYERKIFKNYRSTHGFTLTGKMRKSYYCNKEEK